MDILKITKEDLDKNGFYKEDSIDFIGAIEIDENLGYLKLKHGIKASTYILARAGSGIEAGSNIETGGSIEAGEGIEAGGSIEAGQGIEAGAGIEAGSNIVTGGSIKAGFSIIAKFISCKLRIFAGSCLWKIPSESEMEIKAEVRSGTIAYGILKKGGR